MQLNLLHWQSGLWIMRWWWLLLWRIKIWGRGLNWEENIITQSPDIHYIDQEMAKEKILHLINTYLLNVMKMMMKHFWCYSPHNRNACEPRSSVRLPCVCVRPTITQAAMMFKEPAIMYMKLIHFFNYNFSIEIYFWEGNCTELTK